jgi:hypothetical protein
MHHSARQLDLEMSVGAISRLRIPVDVQQAFGMPNDYPGNVFLNSVAHMPMRELVSETDGRCIAPGSAILNTRDCKRALDAITISFLLSEPYLRRPFFPDTLTYDLILTSWKDKCLYNHARGCLLGAPEFVRIPKIPKRALDNTKSNTKSDTKSDTTTKSNIKL